MDDQLEEKEKKKVQQKEKDNVAKDESARKYLDMREREN